MTRRQAARNKGLSAEERELRDLRERAERADARRNETLTRGEVLDALETAIAEIVLRDVFTGGDAAAVWALQRIKKALS